MNILIDNTAVHNLKTIFDNRSSKVLHIEDVLQLLYFGEHLLLSSKINIVTFSTSIVKETTLETLNGLKKITNAFDTTNQLIHAHDLDESRYIDACNRAADKVSIFLNIFKNKQVELFQLSELANKYTRVYLTKLRKKDSPILSWIIDEYDDARRNEELNRGLEKKAYGAFNYMIASNEIIYSFIRLQYGQPFSRQRKISNLLDTIFRVYLNQELSKNFGTCFYSPAPQRGEIINSLIKNRRDSIGAEIEKRIADGIVKTGGFRDIWLDYLSKNEGINIPLLLIYFIWRKFEKVKTKGSLEAFFCSILEIRDSTELIQIRKDLTDLQKFVEKDISEYEKRMLLINELIQSITKRKDLVRWNIISLLSEIGKAFLTLNPIPIFSASIKSYKELSETKFLKYNYLSSIRQSFVFNDDFSLRLKNILGVNEIIY